MIAMDKKVCVILVNYKTWQDTAECIESILKNDYRNYQIVVIENGSGDQEWENLIKWVRGDKKAFVKPDNKLFALSNPPSPKPLLYQRATVDESKELNFLHANGIMPLLFIKSENNLGFAGGNNVGLRYALGNNFNYAWLLNNDTVIEKNAITELVKFNEDKRAGNHKIGITGSKLLVYHKPDTLQGLGAQFNKYSGKSKILGAQQKDNGLLDEIDLQFNYVIGAAMFVSREFLLDVGLMSEDYFLYNEENDWGARAKRKGWNVSVATKCKVYHKQGASTGNSPKKSKLQAKALNYKYRGKILLYKKYYRPQLPFLYFHLLTRSMKYILNGNRHEANVIFKAILNLKFDK